jgi:hypothetical protein
MTLGPIVSLLGKTVLGRGLNEGALMFMTIGLFFFWHGSLHDKARCIGIVIF